MNKPQTEGWLKPDQTPENKRAGEYVYDRVLVWCPEFGRAFRRDLEELPIYFAQYIPGLNQWRIEGTNFGSNILYWKPLSAA